jgi:hypothetical protein
MTAPRTIIVIPCFDEGARLDPEPLLSFVRRQPGVHLLFVDDGSTDDTAAVVRRMEEAAPASVALLRLGRNHGKAEAVRGDLRAALNLRSGLSNVVWLVRDEPERARREAQEAAAQWTRRGFHLQHQDMMLAQGQTALYVGDGASAYADVLAAWPGLVRSMLLHVQETRLESVHLRARCALAAAAGASAAALRVLLRAATADARRLARERTAWGEPLAALTRAGIANLCGRTAASIALLEAAAGGFDAVDMPLYAAAARYRLGALRGGEAGRTLRRDAEAWLLSQTVRSPPRMVAMLAPGFAD